ncbi:MAG: GDYXXLXY domain-containing protein [Alphaproteobacteria bacterium]
MGRTLRITLLAVAQVMLLGAMIAGYAWDLTRGQEIVVKTRPVDPRSLFRGNYVRLAYPFSRFDASGFLADCIDHGQPLFVTLEDADGSDDWRPVGLGLRAPAIAPGARRVVLRGRARGSYCPNVTNADGTAYMISVDYGISAYFAAPETALALERRMRTADEDQALRLILSVPSSGRALIKGLVLDGERRYDQTLW